LTSTNASGQCRESTRGTGISRGAGPRSGQHRPSSDGNRRDTASSPEAQVC
jgi:hypothetical protein